MLFSCIATVSCIATLHRKNLCQNWASFTLGVLICLGNASKPHTSSPGFWGHSCLLAAVTVQQIVKRFYLWEGGSDYLHQEVHLQDADVQIECSLAKPFLNEAKIQLCCSQPSIPTWSNPLFTLIWWWCIPACPFILPCNPHIGRHSFDSAQIPSIYPDFQTQSHHDLCTIV